MICRPRCQPIQEQQLNQVWHAIVGVAFIVIILAHIYIGSVGMEGAFDAMGSGEVDANWAREHHSLWVEEMEKKGQRRPAGSACQYGVQRNAREGSACMAREQKSCQSVQSKHSRQPGTETLQRVAWCRGCARHARRWVPWRRQPTPTTSWPRVI